MPNDEITPLRKLSPRRNSSSAESIEDLVSEQLEHFAIDPKSDFGAAMGQFARRLYLCQGDIDDLWREGMKGVTGLDAPDRIARFNGLKFLSFQIAKLLDSLQHPSRKSYQALGYSHSTLAAKGPYPVFDNITAIFSATPVIARTATYIYACAEWIEDAFNGEELLHEIYSRLLNPTSISLANHIVDLEAGPYAEQYMAWNFNSGMAAIDATLAHVLGRDDILIASRNIYGGAHQLIHDWYAKKGNLEIAVETFDGVDVQAVDACWQVAQERHAERLKAGRQCYLYLESPCNPHGYMLDLPAICKWAHSHGIRVMLDGTVATPFLANPLRREDPEERPDFLIHSYTKDITGAGSVIAGCVIGRNEDMFIPKGQSAGGRNWDETMFWNVYYVKGAFLNADASFEVLQGMRTLDVRMMRKCVNTDILAKFLDAHPKIKVHCNALPDNPNAVIRERLSHLGLPAPLFTIDFAGVPLDAFRRFFDGLSPTFDHMISLGQSNTIVNCPALTTHSELDEAALRKAGMTPTMIRVAVGDENPIDLIRHFVTVAKQALDPAVAGFSAGFLNPDQYGELIRECYLSAHGRWIDNQLLVS